MFTRNLIHAVARLDAHHRLFVALGVAALVSFAVPWGKDFPIGVVATWDAFALTALLLAWTRIIFSNAREVVRTAKLQDSSRRAIFLFVIVAAVASLFAAAVLLKSANGQVLRNVALTVTTVASSWLLIHTVFALHYAHLFYRMSDRVPAHTEGSGLDFPGTTHPDFVDFAYFSFVIGMACQTADVNITSRHLRRIVLLHGMLSFAFNTMILALTLNLTSGLIQPSNQPSAYLLPETTSTDVTVSSAR
ncbi:MAG TPA: DUF1345 domain-containing protein [Chthoniobacterales bacterium]